MRNLFITYRKLQLIFSLFMLISIVAKAQQTTSTSKDFKNEVKANLLGLAIGLPELSYERLINGKMGIGIAASAGIQNNKGYKEQYKFMIIPHYHYYFGKKYANGFFLEANAAMFSDNVSQAENAGLDKNKIYYGLGGGIGVKHIFGKNFLAEVHLGLGKIINHNPTRGGHVDLGLYRRVGLSIGKRF